MTPPPTLRTRPVRRSSRSRTGRATAILTVVALALTSIVALVTSPTPVGAGALTATTRLVSRTTAGGVAPGVTTQVDMSGNGRVVAFTTTAVMSAADTNGARDVYVRDLWSGVTELVSLTDDDKAVAGESKDPRISDDGRFVLFLSSAANLIPGDDKGFTDAFLRDRYENRTWRISRGISGALLNGNVVSADLSGDGTTTTFYTSATNVVPLDTNGVSDVFAVANFGGDTERVSVTSAEAQGSAASSNPSISDDGRFVAFASDATLTGGAPGTTNAYVRDRTAGTTEAINVSSSETAGNGSSGGIYISGTGRYVAFSSDSTNLVGSDTNGQRDVFVRDRTAGTTVRASLSDGDAQLPTGAGSSDISDIGPTVIFFTNDQATSSPDADGEFDVYARDVVAGSTRRISTGPSLVDPPQLRTSGSVDDSGARVAFVHGLRLTAEQSFDQAYVNGPVTLGPFATSTTLIDRQYDDFLDRTPTAGERSTWSSRFESGQAHPAALIAALAADPAWAATRAPLIRLYWAFFLRRPDASGLTYWLDVYRGGMSLSSIAQSFAKSAEFKARYGTATNQQYVSLVYQNVFERQPDASGLAFWTAKLNSGALTRGGIIVQFSESSEGRSRLAGPTNITLIALGMYRSVPTAAQWDAVYPAIDLGERQAAYIAGTFLDRSDYASVGP